MRPRQVLLAAAAAALLGGAATLVARLQRPADPARPLAGLRASDVARIQLDFSGTAVTLERSGGAWRLASPIQDAADGAAAESLSQSLRGLALGSEVSRDPGGFSDYELDESSAVRVRVYSRSSAAPVLDGYFGKPAMGDSAYFRPSGEASVRLAEGVQPYALRRGPEELRRKELLTLELDDIQSLRFAKPTGFTLERSSGSWRASGRDLSADEAAGIVLAVASLRFSSFADRGPEGLKAGFGRPVLDMTAVTKAGPVERIIFGRSDKGGRWVKAMTRDVAGFVSGPEADGLLDKVRRLSRR